jgi:hypothetical protein
LSARLEKQNLARNQQMMKATLSFFKNEHLGKALELIFLGIGNIIEGLSSHFNLFVM